MSSSSPQISSFCNFSLFTIMAYTSFNRFSLKSETCILPHLQNQFRLHEKMSYHCASATVKFSILFTRSIGQTQCSTKSTKSTESINQSINQSINRYSVLHKAYNKRDHTISALACCNISNDNTPTAAATANLACFLALHRPTASTVISTAFAITLFVRSSGKGK